MAGRKFKPRQPPGVAGGRRHQPDAVQRAQRARSQDRRVQGGLEAARASQAALEARIAAERVEASRLEDERIQRLAVDRQLAAKRRAAEAEEKRQRWNLGEARDLVRQGYSVEHTVARTGWPAEMLADVVMHEW